MYPSSKSFPLILFFIIAMISFLEAQPGLTCGAAGDLSDLVVPNDPIGFQINIDTRVSDQYISYTAATSGTLQFDQGYNGITYLLAYDDQCQVIDEKLLWYSYDVFTIELAAGETVILACDRRNNVTGKEVLNARLHFQETVEGESPANPIPIVEGTNQVTRYLGKQFFKYQTNQTGLLTIKTCQNGNPVDGTHFKLYENGLLANLLQDNVWCSNDPDGDLTQSIIEYQVSNLTQTLVLEASPVSYWYEGYEFEVSFVPDELCDIVLDFTEPTIFEVDNSLGDQWFTFTAPKTGSLEITTGYTSYREGNTRLSLGNDTYIRVFDNCNGSLIALSDDISGGFGASHVVIDVIQGVEYFIQYDDRFTSASYESEVFYTEDATKHALEADAQAVSEGTHRAQVNYSTNHWFSYTFSQTGTLKARNNSSLGLKLPYEEEREIVTYDDDLEKIEFDYDGAAGETVLIRVYDAGYFKEGNADFELTLELAGMSCDSPIEVASGGTYALDHAPDDSPYQGDFWYAFQADEAGELTITNCEQTEAITKVTAFDACGGTRLGVAEGNCDGGAELVLLLEAGDEIVFKWDDHNEPDWNIQDFAYNFEVQFVPDQVEDGISCETAFSISDYNTYAVDNSGGDQWFRFTAPETTEIAITTGPNGAGWGEVNLANSQDTKFKVYDACSGSILVQNDDSPIVKWRRSFATLEVTVGTEYLIQWEDQFVNAPHKYQFEIFKVDDYLGHASEGEPEAIDVGVHRAYLNYKNQHWFKYTFPSDGVLVAVNLDEQSERVIPSYQMFYGDNGLALELPNQEAFAIQNWSDDEPTETNFMYEGVAGEEVLLRVREVAGISFYTIGNRDFELAFFANAAYDDLCYIEADLTEGIYQIDAASGDQKYKFIASEAGTYTFTGDDNPSMLISIYEECFADPVYTKYNDFHYEKQMAAGDEVYLVFLDEYGGKVSFEITGDEPCRDVVDTEIETCDPYPFNEELLTSSDTYEATFTNQTGCDSLVNLTLTMLASTSSETVVEACESYIWNEVTYTSTGVYESLLENAAGCDSTAVLDLTILASTSSETAVEAYESYEWNGKTYETSGAYEVLLVNEIGCDSLAQLELTILDKLPQTITFDKIVDLTYGQDEVQLKATASSGLDVSYEVSNEKIASIQGANLQIHSAGDFSITAVQEGNAQYSPTELTLQLTVDKAVLTVRLGSGSKVYGSENPILTYAYEGFVHDDDEGDLQEIPTATTIATATSDAGSYVITASGGVSDKYEFVYEDGILEIEQADQYIDLEIPANWIYGDEGFDLLAKASSGLSVTYESSDEQVAVINDSKIEIVGTGVSTITAIQSGNQNFKKAEIIQHLTVNKALVKIIANDQIMHFGQQVPDLTMHIEGLVNNETIADLDELPNIWTDVTSESQLGDYEIFLEGGGDQNYIYDLVTGTLTVDAALGTATPLQDLKIYPNPPVSQLFIDLPEDVSDSQPVITVRDMMGRVHYRAAETKRKIEIDLSLLPKGLLILQIQTKDRSYVKSIIRR